MSLLGVTGLWAEVVCFIFLYIVGFCFAVIVCGLLMLANWGKHKEDSRIDEAKGDVEVRDGNIDVSTFHRTAISPWERHEKPGETQSLMGQDLTNARMQYA